MAHALFPGSFDPFTNGHLDLAARAATLFGKVTVAIGRHATRDAMFSLEERIEMASEALRGIDGVEVTAFDGLLVDAAKALGATCVLRGVRASSDYDYEAQMARTNADLSPGFETVFLAPSKETAHLSATLVRQIASMGGDVSKFVPDCVQRALTERFKG